MKFLYDPSFKSWRYEFNIEIYVYAERKKILFIDIISSSLCMKMSKHWNNVEENIHKDGSKKFYFHYFIVEVWEWKFEEGMNLFMILWGNKRSWRCVCVFQLCSWLFELLMWYFGDSCDVMGIFLWNWKEFCYALKTKLCALLCHQPLIKYLANHLHKFF